MEEELDPSVIRDSYLRGVFDSQSSAVRIEGLQEFAAAVCSSESSTTVAEAPAALHYPSCTRALAGSGTHCHLVNMVFIPLHRCGSGTRAYPRRHTGTRLIASLTSLTPITMAIWALRTWPLPCGQDGLQ